MLHKEFFTAAGQPISSNVSDKELTDWIKKEKRIKLSKGTSKHNQIETLGMLIAFLKWEG